MADRCSVPRYQILARSSSKCLSLRSAPPEDISPTRGWEEKDDEQAGRCKKWFLGLGAPDSRVPTHLGSLEAVVVTVPPRREERQLGVQIQSTAMWMGSYPQQSKGG